MPEPIPVTFSPGNVTVWVEAGTTVLDAARRAGVLIDAPCAGRGICGGCGVRLLDGTLDPADEVERQGLRRAPKGVRLACRARASRAVSVRPVVPASVRSTASGSLTAEGSDARCVAAVDLGTTTVAAVLIDAVSRVDLGRSLVANRQRAWGADVIARIAHARDGAAEDLRVAAEVSVREALVAACAGGGHCLGAIERLVIAGNTAMSSLLIGADVTPLAAHPFAAPYADFAELPAASALRAELAPGVETVVLPPLSGFVGGDALAGLISSGLGSAGQRGLLLDMGTNAEIVLATGDEFVVTSAAAGPAFEASGIASGGSASEGAIERVSMTDDGGLTVEVIGGGTARWLCGSGLVSLIATLTRLGHIDASGRMLREGPMHDRFAPVDGVETFVVVESDEPDVLGVVLTQNDVRSFQLAKGAVRAAIEMLVARVQLASSPLADDVVVAGSFGGALLPEDLIALGVLPIGFDDRVRVAGNASLTGAAMLAVDAAVADSMSSLTGRVRHVDLAAEAEFSARYLESLSLEPYELGTLRDRA